MAVAASHDTDELLQMSIGPACHELRSPLAVVYGFARMLEGSDVDPDTVKRYVPQIVRGAERLDGLLDLLSQLGRVAAGRVQPSIDSISIRSVVEDLAGLERNTGRLRIELGDDVTIRADAGWLSESLQAVVDGLCFEEGIDVRLSWTHEKHNIQIRMVPNSSFPMIDVEPDKASLGMALARMRTVAMGGSFDGIGDRILITLPRP